MTPTHRWILGALIILVAAEVGWWALGGELLESLRGMAAITCVVGLALDDLGWWQDTVAVGIREWWRPW